MMKYFAALALLCSVFVVVKMDEEPSKENLEAYRAVMQKNCDNKDNKKIADKYKQCIKDSSSKFTYNSGKAKTDSGVDFAELCKTPENFKDGTKKLLNVIFTQAKIGSDNAKLAEAIKKSDKIIDDCKNQSS